MSEPSLSADASLDEIAEKFGLPLDSLTLHQDPDPEVGRVIRYSFSSGVGFAPIDLMAKGNYERARSVAERYWRDHS